MAQVFGGHLGLWWKFFLEIIRHWLGVVKQPDYEIFFTYIVALPLLSSLLTFFHDAATIEF